MATVALALATLTPATAAAYSGYTMNVPNGTVVRCLTCHLQSEGGNDPRCPNPNDTCLNDFGPAFRSARYQWTQALAEADSDGDGYSNAVELGDPFFTWTAGMANPTIAYTPRSPGLDAGTDGADMNECSVGIDECSSIAICTDELGPASARPATYDCSCPMGYTGDGYTSGTNCTRIVVPPDPTPRAGIPEIVGADYAGEGEWLWVNTTQQDTVPVDTSCGTPTGRDQWFYYPYYCPGEVVIDTEGFNFAPVVSTFDSGAFNASGYMGTVPAPREESCFTPGMTAATSVASDSGAFLLRFAGRYGAAGSGRFRVRCREGLDSGSSCSAPLPLPEQTPTRYTLGPTREPSFSGVPPQDPCPLHGDVWFDYVPTCTGQAEVTLSGYEDVWCDNTRTWGVGAYRGDGCTNLMEEPSGCSGPVPVSPAGTNCASATHALSFGVFAGETYRVRVGGSNTHSGSISVTCRPTPSCDLENGVAGNCDPHADCVPGNVAPLTAPQCVCHPGYAGDGLRTDLGGSGCEPSVCSNAGNACDEEATCSLATGACSCDPGYLSSGTGSPGTSCVDRNECSTSNPCVLHSFCQNRTGFAPSGVGYDCVCQPGLSVPAGSTTCRAVCGDGLVAATSGTWAAEPCDDGNLRAGDGCSASCTLEGTHVCRSVTNNARSVCVKGVCGDGVVQTALMEQCEPGVGEPNTCGTDCKLLPPPEPPPEMECQASLAESPQAPFLAGWLALALGAAVFRSRRRRVH